MALPSLITSDTITGRARTRGIASAPGGASVRLQGCSIGQWLECAAVVAACAAVCAGGPTPACLGCAGGSYAKCKDCF